MTLAHRHNDVKIVGTGFTLSAGAEADNINVVPTKPLFSEGRS